MEEIQTADFQPGEEETLQARYSLAANSRRLIEISTAVAQELTESEPSILSRLGDTARLLRELEKLDPAAAKLTEGHTAALVELEELARELVTYSEKLDLDPEQLAELEERLNLIQTLKRKYGPTLEQVVVFGEEAAARLQKIEHRGAELSRLQNEMELAQAELMRIGKDLSRRRMQAAPELSTAVRSHFAISASRKASSRFTLCNSTRPARAGWRRSSSCSRRVRRVWKRWNFFLRRIRASRPSRCGRWHPAGKSAA